METKKLKTKRGNRKVYDFRLGEAEGDKEKKSSLPSVTVPDESMTIREIVERHVRGQRIDEAQMRRPAFDSGADYDSPDLEKLRDMDLVEKDEFKADLVEKIADQKRKSKPTSTPVKEKQSKKVEDGKEVPPGAGDTKPQKDTDGKKPEDKRSEDDGD